MTNTCYNVFDGLLKSLCLQEFPCGLGSWRNPNEVYADNFSTVTTAGYGANLERLEILQEYLKSGTWDRDTSWSEEASKLQNIAVNTPHLLTGDKGKQYILDFFRNLRMVDKEITIIDPDMVLLRKLTTLTLSVNQIKEIPSKNLPKKLKVLELCMNQIESVSSLCKKPPPLQHLGLSYNLLHSPLEYKHFTANYWPHLLSLDLSHNNLDNLVELLDYLVTLPKLKSLALQGNPLSVIPGYRGYTLDVLRGLFMFDDAPVSAEDKHRFKGLARRKENIRNEAHFIVSVLTLGGVPMPDELKEQEDREEFPVVTSQYSVCYSMLQGQKNLPPMTADRYADSSVPPVNVEEIFDENPIHDQEEVSKFADFESPPVSWSKWIDFNHEMHHVVDDLRAFRDFLRGDLKMKIYHKTTKSWPADEDRDSKSPDGAERKSPMKGDKKDKGKKKSAKGKKKGGDLDTPMKTDPPVITEIGFKEIPLSFLLDSVDNLEDIVHCGGGPMLEREEIIKMQETDRQQIEVSAKSASKKKPRSVSGGSKGKEKKGDHKVEEEPKEEPPPRPITLQIKLELKKWNTAMESQYTD